MPIEVNGRTANYPIDAMFLDRWSPRAFTSESISEAELLTMIEAAGWAPSSYNSQPWRFIYARRDTPHWEHLLNLMFPKNQVWAKDASALMILISRSLMRPPGSDQEVPSLTHSFDTGTASGYFALQARKMGWYVHGMIGFDKERAFAELGLPAGYKVEVAFAIGRLGDKASLPPELQVREAPSARIPLSQIAFEGHFVEQT